MLGRYFLARIHPFSMGEIEKSAVHPYVRDKEKREVDFLMTRDERPWLLCECKQQRRAISPHLYHYAKTFRPAVILQLYADTEGHDIFDVDKGLKGHLISADSFLRLLP